MRVLHVIHDFLPRHRAGSEIYAYELSRRLADRQHEVHVLCAEYDPDRAHGSLVWRFIDDLPVTELINNWTFSSFAATYNDDYLNRQLDHVLAAIQPDVLHIHNLLNLSFQLPALARARGIPSVATLHEFVLVCPSGGQRVHLADRHVCTDIDVERCARCFTQSHFYSQMVFGRISQRTGGSPLLTRLAHGVRRHFPALFDGAARAAASQAATREKMTADDITARLTAVEQVWQSVDLFVAPSPALGADFVRFGLPEDKLKVSDYGFEPLGNVERAPSDGRLRIGFVGTLVWHKGAHVLIEAVRQLPPDSFQLTLYGNLDTFPDYVNELREAAAGLPVEFAGGFEHERVNQVYGSFDVVAVTSLWPENSPLVIHEAFMAGATVVGARMGGIVDLVEHDVSGLLYEAQSAASLAAALSRLLDEPDLLPSLTSNLPAVKTLDQDADEWEEVYREVIDRAGAE